MEQLVLGVLEFNVTVPTAFFFANHFSKVGTYIKSYLYDLDKKNDFTPSIIRI